IDHSPIPPRLKSRPEFARSTLAFSHQNPLAESSFLAQSRELGVGENLQPNAVSLHMSPPSTDAVVQPFAIVSLCVIGRNWAESDSNHEICIRTVLIRGR